MGKLINFLCGKIIDLIRKHRDEIGKLTNKEISDDKLEVIEYGLYNFISEIIKMALLLLIATIMGIFVYSVIALLAFGILRGWAGGVHAKKSHVACFASNITINFTAVYLSMSLTTLDTNILYKINFALFCICLLCLALYAPADVQEKPISSNKKKRKFAILSYIVLIVYYIASVALTSKIIGNILMLSAIGEVLTILPITYKLTNNKLGDVKQFMSEQHY